jgi:hypothetical protein
MPWWQQPCSRAQSGPAKFLDRRGLASDQYPIFAEDPSESFTACKHIPQGASVPSDPPHGHRAPLRVDHFKGGRPECSGRLDRQGEDVPDAALGLDNAGRAGIDLELASQSQDLDVDAAVEHILVDAGRL